MSKENKPNTNAPKAEPLIDKMEFPLPAAALKEGVRLQFDFRENKVRLRIEQLMRWS